MEDNKYEQKLQPRQLVKCPHCGWEYLPCELLFSDQVLGQAKPNSIIRDPLGHILFEEYQKDKEPLAEDTYVCDNCNKPFVVLVETNFRVKKQDKELDFSEKSVSLW